MAMSSDRSSASWVRGCSGRRRAAALATTPNANMHPTTGHQLAQSRIRRRKRKAARRHPYRQESEPLQIRGHPQGRAFRARGGRRGTPLTKGFAVPMWIGYAASTALDICRAIYPASVFRMKARHDGLALEARDRRRGGRVFRLRGADLCKLCEPKCSESDSAGASSASLIRGAYNCCRATARAHAHRRCSVMCLRPG
jgi:hypothetical protein